MEENKSYKSTRYSIDGHHHGLFIKEARLRKGYRLVEVAEEICDTSYLCKIESGALIPPPGLFSKLVEKLEIQFPSEVRTCHIGIFRKALYQGDLSKITSSLKTDTFHHYEIQMLTFFQAVINHELPKAFTLKKMIDQFYHHFDLKEQQIYLLFSGIYFFKSFEWEQGKTYFEKSLELTHQIQEEDPYLYFELAKYYFQMQKGCLGFSYLERATTEFKKIYEKGWVFRCGILWCKESMKNDDVKNIEKRLEELRKIIDPCENSLQWSYFFNILGMIYEKRGQDIQAEEYYTKSIEPRSDEINEEFIIDAIKFHYRRQNSDQMIKLIERLDLKSLSARSRILVDFYYFKITDETSEYFERFLRKDAIPFAMKALDPQNALLYTKELAKYHRNKLCHKKGVDAYYKWEKFCEEWNLTGMI